MHPRSPRRAGGVRIADAPPGATRTAVERRREGGGHPGLTGPRPAWERWLPPAVAYVASTLLAWLVAALSGRHFWTVADRMRWDSEHYLSIADRGYEQFPCSFNPSIICGNTAWFPGYPAAVRVVSFTGLPSDIAGILVTEVSLLALLVVLWRLLGGTLNLTTAGILGMAVAFPGGIYFHTIFPIALGTLALLVCVVGITRESWLLAAVGGFVATSCHLVGAVAPIMLALSVVFAWRSSPWPVRALKAFGSSGLAASAYVVTLWLMWLGTDRWDAYWVHQRSAYGQGGLNNPLDELRAFFEFPFEEWNPVNPADPWLVRHTVNAHQSQLVLNIAIVVVFLGVFAWRAAARDIEPLDCAALLLALGVFAVPFLGGAEMSWYRNHAMMLVALPLLRRSPPLLAVGLVLPLAVQYALLGAMWFRGSLV